MWTYNNSDELYHHGIKGMRWGVRRSRKQLGYKSTSIGSALARKQNEKVDKGFKKWKEESQKRDNAIELGKKRNLAKMAYESNKSDKSLKTAYKTANKDYKKAMKSNTTYRKGVVKQEVGQDLSRKYLSEAKRIKKQLDADPNNKALQKRYNSLMSEHDVERARARRATAIATKRSQKKASIKRTMTTTAKAVAGTAAVTAGAYAVNSVLKRNNVRFNGAPVNVGKDTIRNAADFVKKGKDLMGYFV